MENKFPIVSIIVPAYNVEEYIARGIESVLEQTYKNIELIIVDDGSKDNTAKVIGEYAEKDNRVKFYSKMNGGVSSARNVALTKATGEYILFLDSDDWLEAHTVEYLLKMIEGETKVLVSADCFFAYLNDDGSIRKEKHRDVYKRIKVNRHDALLTTGNGEYNLQSSCYKLYSRKVIIENNITFREDIAHGEDGLFVFRYINCVEGLLYDTEPLWNILERPNSATTAPYNKKWLSALKAVDEMISCTEDDKELNDALKVFFVQRTVTVFMACLRNLHSEKEEKKYLRRRLKEHKKVYLQSDLTRHDKLVYRALLSCPFFILRYIV